MGGRARRESTGDKLGFALFGIAVGLFLLYFLVTGLPYGEVNFGRTNVRYTERPVFFVMVFALNIVLCLGSFVFAGIKLSELDRSKARDETGGPSTPGEGR